MYRSFFPELCFGRRQLMLPNTTRVISRKMRFIGKLLPDSAKYALVFCLASVIKYCFPHLFWHIPLDNLLDIGVNLTDPMFRGEYRGKRAHAGEWLEEVEKGPCYGEHNGNRYLFLFCTYADDFGSVMGRARKAGVERMIITGGSLSESVEALSLAETDRK